jgi:hypothetical protein
MELADRCRNGRIVKHIAGVSKADSRFYVVAVDDLASLPQKADHLVVRHGLGSLGREPHSEGHHCTTADPPDPNAAGQHLFGP